MQVHIIIIIVEFASGVWFSYTITYTVYGACIYNSDQICSE